jgi:cell wall-associated NlpC family hydrolase
VIRQPKRQPVAVLVLFAALTALSFAAATASASPRIDAKRAEAQQVLDQIAQIDANLERAVDAYNGAQLKLAGIEAQQGLNRHHLWIARHNYKNAQRAISRRLVSLYTDGESSFVEVLLGATSLGDLLDRVDTANRISEQDARIVQDLVSARHEMRRRGKELKRQQAEQSRLVAARAAAKASIESQLGERRRLLSSIKGEIVQLQAEEAARQRRLEAEARARLAAAQSAPADVGSPTGAVDSSSSSSSIAPAPASQYGGVVGIAMQYLGVPYVWGGASPSGFDCSGFVMYVFAQVGVSLPHHAASIYNYGVPVSRDQLEPGDLLFFDGLGHMGIYIGGGQFVHAPHTGDVVKISSLDDSWYAAAGDGAKRIL